MKSNSSQILYRSLKLRGHTAAMRPGTPSERALWATLRPLAAGRMCVMTAGSKIIVMRLDLARFSFRTGRA